MTLTLSFNEQEAQAMMTLLDMAVKNGGLSAAGAAFAMQQKFATAARMQQAVPTVAPQAEEG